MQEERKMNDKTRLRKKLDERIRDLSKAENSLFEIMICTDTGNKEFYRALTAELAFTLELRKTMPPGADKQLRESTKRLMRVINADPFLFWLPSSDQVFRARWR
jgi:hypothetical protein